MMHIIPFYYSFKEFKDNYQTDLENWLSVYEEADENAFIEILKHKYSFRKDDYELYYIGDVYPEKENVTLDMFIDQLISNLINLLERNVTISDIHTNMFIVGDFLRFNYGYGKGYFFENDFLREFDTIYSNGVDFISDPNTFFENNQFSFLKGFIEVDFENMTLKPNFIKHDNYYYAQNKIQHFIFEKINIYTEKALEEETKRKIEARQEYNQLIIEKLAERKEKQKKEEELKQDLLVETIVSKLEDTLKVKRDESNVKLSRSEVYIHDVFKSEFAESLFNQYVSNNILDEYLDFSFIFQQMKEDNLIHHFKHEEFMYWLFEINLINKKTLDSFLIKKNFVSLNKCSRDSRLNVYLRLKEIE